MHVVYFTCMDHRYLIRIGIKYLCMDLALRIIINIIVLLNKFNFNIIIYTVTTNKIN